MNPSLEYKTTCKDKTKKYKRILLLFFLSDLSNKPINIELDIIEV